MIFFYLNEGMNVLKYTSKTDELFHHPHMHVTVTFIMRITYKKRVLAMVDVLTLSM